MSWWVPWRRKHDTNNVATVAEDDKQIAEERLVDAKVLAIRARETSRNLRDHMRRNDFASMIADEAFGRHRRD